MGNSFINDNVRQGFSYLIYAAERYTDIIKPEKDKCIEDSNHSFFKERAEYADVVRPDPDSLYENETSDETNEGNKQTLFKAPKNVGGKEAISIPNTSTITKDVCIESKTSNTLNEKKNHSLLKQPEHYIDIVRLNEDVHYENKTCDETNEENKQKVLKGTKRKAFSKQVRKKSTTSKSNASAITKMANTDIRDQEKKNKSSKKSNKATSLVPKQRIVVCLKRSKDKYSSEIKDTSYQEENYEEEQEVKKVSRAPKRKKTTGEEQQFRVSKKKIGLQEDYREGYSHRLTRNTGNKCIDYFTEMGFTVDAATEAIVLANYNFDDALTLLTEGKVQVDAPKTNCAKIEPEGKVQVDAPKTNFAKTEPEGKVQVDAPKTNCAKIEPEGQQRNQDGENDDQASVQLVKPAIKICIKQSGGVIWSEILKEG